MKLRKLEIKDAEAMLEWMHSKNVVEMLAQNFENKSLEDCKQFIKNANEDESIFLHRAICNDKDEYLGTVSLKHINMQDRNAEYAISMREKAMGTDGREAIRHTGRGKAEIPCGRCRIPHQSVASLPKICKALHVLSEKCRYKEN